MLGSEVIRLRPLAALLLSVSLLLPLAGCTPRDELAAAERASRVAVGPAPGETALVPKHFEVRVAEALLGGSPVPGGGVASTPDLVAYTSYAATQTADGWVLHGLASGVGFVEDPSGRLGVRAGSGPHEVRAVLRGEPGLERVTGLQEPQFSVPEEWPRPDEHWRAVTGDDLERRLHRLARENLQGLSVDRSRLPRGWEDVGK